MIPEEMLRAAAGAWERYYARLTAEYAPGQTFPVSEAFEKKIRRLKQRADHPVLYRTLKRVAIFLLTLLIAGTVWLSLDTDARAAVFGWFSDISDNYFDYHHKGVTGDISGSADYRPSWIPEGYSEESVRLFNDKTTVLYKNNDGKLLRFSYVITNKEYNWSFDISKGYTQSCHVSNYEATLFISEDDDVASAITWIDSKDTAFFLTGFITDADLIRIAESVSVIEK